MIGASEYENLPDLKTPLNDIDVLSDILSSKYDFKIEKLINPTRKDITSKLSKIEKHYPNHSLLIYYAGHGIEKMDLVIGCQKMLKLMMTVIGYPMTT